MSIRRTWMRCTKSWIRREFKMEHRKHDQGLCDRKVGKTWDKSEQSWRQRMHGESVKSREAGEQRTISFFMLETHLIRVWSTMNGGNLYEEYKWHTRVFAWLFAHHSLYLLEVSQHCLERPFVMKPEVLLVAFGHCGLLLDGELCCLEV